MGYCVLPNGTSFLASKLTTKQNNLLISKYIFKSLRSSTKHSHLPSKLKKETLLRLYDFILTSANIYRRNVYAIFIWNLTKYCTLFQTCSFSSFSLLRRLPLASSRPTFLGVRRPAKVSNPCESFALTGDLLIPPRTCLVPPSPSTLQARGPELRQGRFA